MTELDLYKFINENSIEWHKEEGGEIYIFPFVWDIEEFSKLIAGYHPDEGFKCNLRDNYICFKMNDICDYFEIDLNKIFQEK